MRELSSSRVSWDDTVLQWTDWNQPNCGSRAIAEATLLSRVMKLHQTLAEWERAVVERLVAMPAIHIDETSLRVGRKNRSIHIDAAGGITLKLLRPGRGGEAAGILRLRRSDQSEPGIDLGSPQCRGSAPTPN